MSLKDHVERYITFKQHMGFKYGLQAHLLRNYAEYAIAHGDAVLDASRIIAWATKVPSGTGAELRLRTVRTFATWLHAEDERHEVPPRDVLGRLRNERPPPHLLTPRQIGQIMDAALALPHASLITRQTYHCAIGLMATTGLRRSEAVALRFSDLTSDGLVVRQTKFRKSRLVPILESTQDALAKYLVIRKRAHSTSNHIFVPSTGRPLHADTLSIQFLQLARQVGIRGGVGERGPRLHDLRHSFAVRCLESAVADDPDSVCRHMLALSTYLGHSCVSSTYWYLEATPTLLHQIAQAAEKAHTEEASS